MAETNGEQPTRNSIRSNIFSAAKNRRSERIEMFGYEVEIRQPTVGQVLEIQNSGNTAEMMLDMLVNQTFVPGTGEPVFDEMDKDELRKLPADEWLNQFNDAVLSLTRLNTEDAEKN